MGDATAKGTSARDDHPSRLTLAPFPRTEEIECLRQAWKETTETGKTHVVVVEGPSGVGKSMLVATAFEDMESCCSCWRASAKAEFQQRGSNGSDLPLAPIQQLLTEIAQNILIFSPTDTLESTRHAIQQNLRNPSHINTLISLVPALEMLLVSKDYDPRKSSTMGGNNPMDDQSQQLDQSGSFGSQRRGGGEIHGTGLAILKLAVREFFKAIGTIQPIILSLDDIMWCDEATLAVLGSLLTDASLQGMLFCATARDTMEDADQKRLDAWTKSLRFPMARAPSTVDLMAGASASTPSEGPKMTDIQLKNLKLEQLVELLSNSFGSGGTMTEYMDNNEKSIVQARNNQIQELATFLHDQTMGNLFFMTQILEDLQATNVVFWDYESKQWTWDLTRVPRTSLTATAFERVIKVVVSRLHRLPAQALAILKLAACLGTRFTMDAIQECAVVFGIRDDVETGHRGDRYSKRGHTSIISCLESLCDQDFLMKPDNLFYKFSHDTIQASAYSILLKERSDEDDDNDEYLAIDKIHWDIGLLLCGLWQKRSSAPNGATAADATHKDNDWLFFTCVDQLNLGAANNAHSADECRKVAELNLQAGKRAAQMSAFLPASNYVQAGIDVLGATCFSDSYCDLAIQLHSLYAKTEFCIGHIQNSMEIANNVIKHCKTIRDKESPYLTLIACYWADNKINLMADFCLDLLENLGEKLPRKPHPVMFALEQQKAKHILKVRSDDDILSLPRMTNESKMLAMRILCEMVFPLKERIELLGFVSFRMLHITCKYGLTKFTPEAMAVLGAYLASSGSIKEGIRAGNLAEKLLNSSSFFNQKELKGRTYAWISGCTRWWAKPIPINLDMLIKGNEYCMAAGSITFACHCHVMYSINFFYSGLPLGPLLKDVEKICNLFLEYGQLPNFRVLTPLWHCLLNLTGKSKDPSNMEVGVATDTTLIAKLGGTTGKGPKNSYWMQILFYLGDYERASEIAQELKADPPGLMKSMVFSSTRSFFICLLSLSDYRRKGRKRKDKVEALKYIKYFHKLVSEGAVNILHKLKILEAEFASLSGEKVTTDKMCRMYDEAIIFARKTGFLQDAALANYLCFQICVERQELLVAEGYLKDAFVLWKMWNANAIAESLCRRHPEYKKSFSSIAPVNGSHRSREVFNSSLMQQHKVLSL